MTFDPTVETWATIAEFPSYQVSTFGRVRNAQGRVLAPCKLKVSGHCYITFRLNGKNVVRYIHRLVLLTFVGKPRRGEETLMIDGNPDNCRLDNLEWAKRTDKPRPNERGAGNGNARLTNAQATAIRYRALAGESGAALAREYMVNKSTVSEIKTRKIYTQDYCTTCGKPCWDHYLCSLCLREE